MPGIISCPILALSGPVAAGLAVVALVVGVVATFVIQKTIARNKLLAAETEAKNRVEVASRQAENIVKEAQLNAANEFLKKKEKFTAEVETTQAELLNLERRLSKREDTLDRQAESLTQKDKQLRDNERELEQKHQSNDAKAKHLSNLITQQKNQLLKISNLDVEQAKEMLLKRLEEECERK